MNILSHCYTSTPLHNSNLISTSEVHQGHTFITLEYKHLTNTIETTMAEEAPVWKRPESIPFPTVWWRCTGKQPLPNGKIPKFRIQDATEDQFDEIMFYMRNIFSRDELISARCGVPDDPVSLEESVALWRKYLNMMITVVAVVDDEDEEGKPPRIAGFNILGVSLRNDKAVSADMFKGKALQKVIKFIFEFALKDLNVFDIYGVDEYMSALGLFVHPDFRGQGLSEHLIRARFPLGKALGLKATMTFFTPAAAHRASLKAGMHLIREVRYDSYMEDGKVIFPDIPSKYMKVMGARFE